MKMALVWPNIFSGTIIVVYLMALFGNENAKALALEGWEGMAVLLAGAGMRMAKDVAMVRAKSRSIGSQDIGGTDL